MSIYDTNGLLLSDVYDMQSEALQSAYDVFGTEIYSTGDYDHYDTEYQHTILNARNDWLSEVRSGDDVIPQIIHTDQHGRLTANNALFPYLGLAINWDEVSACIGLGDVTGYNVAAFQAMLTCLDDIPASKQINIWGNHDTWGGSREINGHYVPTAEEYRDVLSYYFDNSAYNGNIRYNDYGIESMIDSKNHIKYIVIGGWEYDSNLGGYSHYVIGTDSMDYIIQMLHNTDGNDIVILSHLQLFAQNKGHDTWVVPYEDACGGAGLTKDGTGVPGTVVDSHDCIIDQLLIDRKNKSAGTVRDSYGISHNYDFSDCTGDLICCFAGHEHCNWYNHQNGNIPVVIYDAYAYDTHPFYFVNINRTKKQLAVWRVDDTPQFVKWSIPFLQANNITN